MYVHPDKNPADKEKADIAFEGEYCSSTNKLDIFD